MTETNEERMPGAVSGTPGSGPEPQPRTAPDRAGPVSVGSARAGSEPASPESDGSESDTPDAAGSDAAGSELTDPDAAESSDALGGTLAALADEDLDAAGRRRALGRLADQLRLRGVGDLFKPRAAMRWIADALSDVVPHMPIRDAATLRLHFPGMSDPDIAERLTRNASRATAAVGAAGGGIAAVEWVATPTLLTAPIVLATETVAVVAIEIKLVGELHELFGSPIRGTGAARTVSLLHSWAQRRGINPMMPGVGVAAVLGTGVRKELRDRLLKRFGRNLTSYGPMLTGAAVASYLNRRATLTLANQIRDDLRRARAAIEPD